MWLIATFIGAAILFASDANGEAPCKKTYKKIGCFYDDQAAKDMQMVINGRSKIDWYAFKDTTHSLACDCIAKARALGYDFIRIGFYGECKGGKDFAKKFLGMTRSSSCINVDYSSCIDDADHNCVGVANSGYIYKLDGGRDRDVAKTNGGYSEWSEWSTCSVSCGSGEQERERTCSNPLPSGGGNDCTGLGPSEQSQSCKIKECPVDGVYSEWSAFGECSTTCGPGKRTATRKCTAPQHGGKDCEGSAEKTEDCKVKECAVDGGFSDWSAFGKCSVSCGKGHKKSTRTCTNPAPAHGGEDCIGDHEKIEDCDMKPCPVDGRVTSWSNYGECSVSCGGGEKTRTRTCTNPAPANGGADCTEPLSDTKSCKPDPCPIDGGFSIWSEFDECTATCGGGTRQATRQCNNPAPQHGGKYCDGETTKIEKCAETPCPVDGVFGPWSVYGKCSVSCGGGEQEKTRKCTPPQHGGKECVGPTTESRACGTIECPVDGGLSDWGDYGICSEKCGGGVQLRKRECNNPKPAHGGKNCEGELEETKSCNTDPCPINGGFSVWGDYSKCTVTCGGGTQTRSRECNNPTPENGGTGCAGETESSRECNSNPCPIGGGLSKWSEYTKCSASCGGGTKERERQCNNPTPQYGGANCIGELNEEVACNENPCPIDGGFTSWTPYGKCSVECGDGTQTSTRSCTNPAPQHGGKDCDGDLEKTRKCSEKPCPIDGGFSDWSEYDTCSARCGGGEQTRTRTCNNPAPQHGGKVCDGESEETRDCNTHNCPIDGRLSDWSSYSECTASCGGGSKTRSRSCTNPAPQYGGKECVGKTSMTVKCGMDACPVDGGFSDWSDYSTCTKTCGGGMQTKTRSCNNPSPAHGGKDCDGDLSESRDCATDPCPINGKFTEWSAFGSCDKSCGGGMKEATRSCTNPAPEHGGEECFGPTTKTSNCNVNPCPIDGGFTDWSDYGECSVSCGGGTQSSSRTCTNPSPKYGGKSCAGETTRSQDCGTDPCPINGGVSKWSDYETCSVSCGGGMQKRTRTCTNPQPQHGGKDCEEELEETRKCNEAPCPIDGKFTEWSDFGECSEKCDGGKKERSRSCTNPAPQYGGKECVGPDTDSESCNTHECPVDGAFSKWSTYSECSKSCGGGKRFATRACTRPKPAFGGKVCVGETRKEQPCNTQPCPIDGGWTDYGEYSVCSKPCAGGIQKAMRSCTNPRPQHGGKKCTGLDYKMRVCNKKHCPIDGGFTDWKKSGECSKTCGGGKQRLERTCTNPEPKYEGSDCTGASSMETPCNTHFCPVDGGFGKWGEYSECSAECGGGKKMRTRSCNNPTPAHGGKECSGETLEEADCNTHECPVDGGLTDWGDFSKCTKSCGGGEMTRTRTCTNPSPAHGGKGCTGALSDTTDCNENPCPINGRYSAWSKFEECSEECGGGKQARTRSCTNPAPRYGGESCKGPSRNERVCNSHPCPVNGGFTDWSEFSKCSKVCGGGMKSKTRSCTSPAPAHGGSNCVGDTTLSEKCNTHPCPINGGFGPWGKFDTCTKSCGGGIHRKYRKCDSPKPQHGGKNCVGPTVQLGVCSTNHCPVDGGWSDYSKFTACTKSCGGGIQERSRKCNSPAPAYGGKTCVGAAVERRVCGARPCPVDGGYTSWSAYDKCTEKCGGGVQERRRSCTKPTPLHGGRPCDGPSAETRRCNINPCPINGGFSVWGPFDKCTKSCGGGSQTSRRTCTQPEPKFGGVGCVGPLSRTRACNTNACPVNGKWSNWGPFDKCTSSCGGGIHKKYRECNNPSPAHGGAACAGADAFIQACNTKPCPVNGKWSSFGRFGACTKPCGGGTQKRYRKCNSPAPLHGGKACGGLNFQLQACNKHHCPVNGGLSGWSAFGRCSKECGGGIKSRSRTCTNPAPAHGGKACSGSTKDMTACNTHHCPINGNWGGWQGFGACSASCGGGTKTRTRPCNNPAPAHGGRTCPGTNKNVQSCNTHHCPINGKWSNWGAYGTCSKTCGGGVMKKYRTCNSPAPQYHGKACAGTNVYMAACNTQHCPVDGNWGGWGPFGACTRTCDGGIHRSFRQCNNPAPAHGGKNCVGSPFKFQGCATQRCQAPVNGNWGAWSSFGPCSKNCGGIKLRTRYCNNPAPSGGGSTCTGSNQFASVCRVGCKVDGQYGSWTAWSGCSKTCGGGTQSRSRPCNNPAPSNGGSNCVGPATAIQACNTNACPVRYSGQKTAIACEHGHMSISCGHGGIIEVQYANYGRTNAHICGHHGRTGCRAGNSWSYVYSRCHNRNSCYLKSNNSEFGDPCWGTFKYLEVKYRCRGGPYAG